MTRLLCFGLHDSPLQFCNFSDVGIFLRSKKLINYPIICMKTQFGDKSANTWRNNKIDLVSACLNVGLIYSVIATTVLVHTEYCIVLQIWVWVASSTFINSWSLPVLTGFEKLIAQFYQFQFLHRYQPVGSALMLSEVETSSRTSVEAVGTLQSCAFANNFLVNFHQLEQKLRQEMVWNVVV